MIRKHPEGIVLKLLVVPNAKKNEIAEVDAARNRLKIRVKAPPAEGRANKELVRFLSKLLGVKAEIVRGEKNREKDVLLKNAKPEDIEKKLGLRGTG